MEHIDVGQCQFNNALVGHSVRHTADRECRRDGYTAAAGNVRVGGTRTAGILILVRPPFYIWYIVFNTQIMYDCRLLLGPIVLHSLNCGLLAWRTRLLEAEPKMPTFVVEAKRDMTDMSF